MAERRAGERPLPLFDWFDARRRLRARRRRLCRRAAVIAAASAALLATIALPPRPRLVWNASASAPIGLYAVVPGAVLARGDMVIAWLPARARDLAARRHYLPRNVPLVKRVAAIPGEDVCARDRLVSIDGRVVVQRLVTDALGRPLPWWRGCLRLTHGAVFLLMAEMHDSFDGRYFGGTDAHDIVGRAIPLWTR